MSTQPIVWTMVFEARKRLTFISKFDADGCRPIHRHVVFSGCLNFNEAYNAGREEMDARFDREDYNVNCTSFRRVGERCTL